MYIGDGTDGTERFWDWVGGDAYSRYSPAYKLPQAVCSYGDRPPLAILNNMGRDRDPRCLELKTDGGERI